MDETLHANLSVYRIQQVNQFAITGVDYAGPILLKGHRGRNSPHISAYICLFVCIATKALPTELLSSDLSTETILLAFTRYVARHTDFYIII